MGVNEIHVQPLAGRKIVITRPPEQSPELASALEALGATVISLPAIEIASLNDYTALDTAIGELATYDWLVFTSANGVRAFDIRLAALGKTWSDRGRARIASIGPATGRALAERDVPPDLTPAEFVAEALGEALGNVAGQRILLARADIAREALAEDLTVRGADVSEIRAYRTVPRPISAEALAEILALPGVEWPADAITFTSSSTVHALIAAIRQAGLDPAGALRGIALAAIGPITASTLHEAGLEPAVVAQDYTVPGLVRVLSGYFARKLQEGAPS
jgi:uroporphyrinogen-III synthase